jgi:hypothetical protein
MPLTPNQALPYQTEDDQLGPEAIEALARAVETQLVMVFASAADRASKVSVPTEGMFCWLQDINRFERHNGTAWAEVPDLAKVIALIDGYDSRPKGPIGDDFVNATLALTGTGQLLASVTFSCPSSSRVYQWRYQGLFATTDASGAVAHVGTTVATGSSPSGGGTPYSSWQVPIARTTADGGSRIDLIGRGSSFATGTVTLGIYAEVGVGSDVTCYGPRFLNIDDVGA